MPVTNRNLIGAWVDPGTKARFADLARRSGLSESDLLRRLIGDSLGEETDALRTKPTVGFTHTKGCFSIRLRPEELAAVEPLARVEARSIPAWIVALVRARAQRIVPLCDAELDALNAAIATLGPLGRNLNVLVRRLRDGEVDAAADDELRALATAVQELRGAILDVVDAAHRRYRSDAG